MPIDKDLLKDLYKRINEAFKGDGSFQFTPPEITLPEEDDCPPGIDQGNYGHVWTQGSHVSTYVPSNNTSETYTYMHGSFPSSTTSGDTIWTTSNTISSQPLSRYQIRGSEEFLMEKYLALQEVLCRELEDIGVDSDRAAMILDIQVLAFISLIKIGQVYAGFVEQLEERWEEDIECNGEDS